MRITRRERPGGQGGGGHIASGGEAVQASVRAAWQARAVRGDNGDMRVRGATCQAWRGKGTYDPSGLRDSGITRSSVRGSTAIPAVVVSGTIAGFDIVVVVSETLINYTEKMKVILRERDRDCSPAR